MCRHIGDSVRTRAEVEKSDSLDPSNSLSRLGVERVDTSPALQLLTEALQSATDPPRLDPDCVSLARHFMDPGHYKGSDVCVVRYSLCGPDRYDLCSLGVAPTPSVRTTPRPLARPLRLSLAPVR